MAQVIIALTAATSAGVWYAPVDCTGTITVELIGPGNGGGGGAYVKSTLTGITPGAKYYTNFLNDTWINTVNSAPIVGSSNATGAKASGATFSTGAGGLVVNSAYNVLAYSGGSGPGNFGTSTSQGAGGAAGPAGPGGNGQAGVDIVSGGVGGSSNGRPAGYNGGGVGGSTGTADLIWTDFAGNQYGPAGGASLGAYSSSKSGGQYSSSYSYGATAGGGGITGGFPRNGLIIITYTPTQIAGTYTEVIRTPGTTLWRVPLGVTSVKAEAIGAGGPGHAGSGGYSQGLGAGGGGAYAATNSILVLPETVSYVFLGPSDNNFSSYTATPSWFNSAYNAPPTSTATGVKAAGGDSGGKAYNSGASSVLGGLASNSIGDNKFDGGSGELPYRVDVFRRGAGGGGAAGPGGAGRRGGKDNLLLNTTGGGGGGGGAGGAGSTVGGDAVTSTGGKGGNGPSGTIGQPGGSGSGPANPGSNGTGGAGGGGTATGAYRNGANGSTYPIWTNITGDTFGPGGGGGGAGGTSSTINTLAGAGGTYGGGGGSGGSITGSAGGQGLIVLTYTVAAVSTEFNRYWVGGSGTWDGTSTTNWSTQSGGASGASVPTSVNNVFFDANSNTGTGAFTVTIATTAVCMNFDATGVDGTMTLAGTAKLQIYGNFTLPLTLFTNSFTGTLYFAARTTGKTINFNGKSFSNIIFDGSGGKWTLADPLTATASVTLSGGTLDLGGFVLSAFNFVGSGLSTRLITFNGGSITLTGNANTSNQTLWDMSTSTGFSVTGNPVVNVPNASTNSGFTRTFNHGSVAGGIEANAISLNIQAGNTGSVVSVSGAFLDLNFTGCSSTLNNTVKNIYGSLTLSPSMSTIAGANLIIFASTARTTRLLTANGIRFNCPIAFNGDGGVWQLQDTCDTGGYSIQLASGTFDSNNKNIICDTFSYSDSYFLIGYGFTNAGIRTLILGTSTVTITGGSNITGFVGSSNYNVKCIMNNATIVFTTTSTSCYSNDSSIIENGAGTVTMAGTGRLYLGSGTTVSSCSTLNNTANQACTFILYCSVAFTVANFAVTGSEKNSVVINSASGSYKTLKQLTGTVNSYYLVIQDTVVTGGATWNAYNSIDGRNNTGWNFLGNIGVVFKISGTFTIPVGITSITAEAIGGGGAGASAQAGGGGGAYAKSNIIAVTPGNLIYVGVGSTSDSWANTVNSIPVVGTTPVTQAVLAKAGTATAGGQASASSGNVKFSGGNSGAVAVVGPQRSSDPGGGGAAGPGGNGGAGGAGVTSGGSYLDTYGGGGGGGADGGSTGKTATTANQAGAAGGNNASGTGAGIGGIAARDSGRAGIAGAGGGGGGGDDGIDGIGTGGAGSVSPIRAWGSYGPGSGAGGQGGGIGGSYGTGPAVYGGGSAGGSSGIVVISYSVSIGNAIALFF